MSLLFNGIDQYCRFQNNAMAVTNGAVAIWYQYQAGPNILHYLMSTGNLSNTAVNVWYSSGGVNAGTIALHRGTTFANKLNMPDDFKNGATPYLIIWERNETNNYLWYCKAGGSAVRVFCGTYTSLSGNANWNLLRRADGNPDRYASGVLQQFFKITTTAGTPLTDQQVEDLANEVTLPQNLSNADIVFLVNEGSGATATDVIRNQVMTLHGNPQWLGGSSGASFSSQPLRDNTGQLLANRALDYVALYRPDTGDLVVRVTGLSTDSNGVFAVASVELNPDNQYRVDWKLANGASRMPLGTAL